MFIAGTFDWASTLEQGEFLCPKCGTTKTYQRKVARTFLTVYFVPILPISGLHEFVVCRGCRERFETSVLAIGRGQTQREPQAIRAVESFDEELLRLMALMIVEDDFVTEPEIQMAQRIYQGMLMRELPRTQLERACREVTNLRINPMRYIAAASQGMTYDQKIMAVQAMFAVAGAEGQISAKRLKSLMQAQHQLGLDDSAFQNAVKEASSWVA